MSTKAQALAAVRRSMSEAKADALEMGAGFVTSYAIGSLEASGRMASIPQILGMPRTATLAVVAKGVAYAMGGKVRSVANGIGNAASHIGVYQFARGGAISGAPGILANDSVDGSRRARIAQLEAEARRALSSGSGRGSAHDELEQLERRTA